MNINALLQRSLCLMVGGLLLIGPLNSIRAASDHAANECRIKYQYTVSTGTFSSETKTAYVNLNINQTKQINQSNTLWVQNLKDYKVRVYRSGIGEYVDLDKDGRDPAMLNYLGNVVLQQVKCLNVISSSGFQTAGAMVEALKAAGVALDQIAAQVGDAFNVGGQQMAELLKAAQYDAGQVAGALQSAFNASGQQVGQWLKQAGYSTAQVASALRSAFNASGQQVAQWLKQAGYNAAQIASALQGAFNASGQQVGQWMKQAGYSANQIAGALKSSFNASAEEVGQWLKQLGYGAVELAEALKPQFGISVSIEVLVDVNVCGAAGCQPVDVMSALRTVLGRTQAQAAALMRQAGYSAMQIAEALNASKQQTAQWLEAADFALNDVAKALKNELNASAEEAAQLLAAVFNASEQAIRQALAFAGYTQAQINAAFQDAGDRVARTVIAIDNVISGYTKGYHGIPIAKPDEPFPLRPGRNSITIRGRGLIAATALSGLPPGSRYRITGRGSGRSGRAAWDYIHVEINASSRTRIGTRGRATVQAAGAKGPTFRWVVQRATTTSSGGSTPIRGTRGRGGSRSSGPDLVPVQIDNSLYKVGSATTMDANQNVYTALNPFNNSPFCQGVPQGGTARNNMPTANRRDITVPDVRWGVENTSSVDVNQAFTVQLVFGGRVVASQRVNRLARGQRAEFTYQRPQSTATVARVGPGNGCYHAGLSGEGWSDNAGYSVRVDTQSEVSEANEGNNQRAL